MTPSLRTVAFVTVALLPGCGAPASPAPTLAGSLTPSAAPAPTQNFGESRVSYVFSDRERVKKLEATFPAIDAIAQRELDVQHVPGFALGIVIDGKLAYAKGFGYADVDRKIAVDSDTIFRLGSITKTFTSLAILELRDEGKLGLDDPLTRFVPEASGLVYPTRDAAPITLRDLLTHSSGLPRESVDHTRGDVAPTEGDVLRSLQGLELESAPKTTYSYSTLGMYLLGIVGSRVAKESYRDLVRDKILTPLAMKSTSFDVSSLPADKVAVPYRWSATRGPERVVDWAWGAAEPGGGLWSSLNDVSKYVAFELDAYPPRDAPDTGPVRRATVRESHYDVVRGRTRVSFANDPRRTVDLNATNYGMPWFVHETCNDGRVIEHAGGSDGFTAQIQMLPDSGVGVVVLRNFLTDGAPWPQGFVDAVTNALRRGGGLAPRVAKFAPAPAFDAIVPKVRDLYNHWDDHAYEALLSPRRQIVLVTENEKKVFATLHDATGDCSTFEPHDPASPYESFFRFKCARGTLDLRITLAQPDGLVYRHFHGTARDVEAPPNVRAIGDDVVGLLAKWDDAVWTARLAGVIGRSHDDAKTVFGDLGKAHGACSIQGFRHWADAENASTGTAPIFDGMSFWLKCERGDLDLELQVDPRDATRLIDYSISGDSAWPCSSARTP